MTKDQRAKLALLKVWFTVNSQHHTVGISFQHRLYLNQSKRVLHWNRTISSLNRKFVTLGLELKEQEVGFGDTLAPCFSRKRCTKYHFDYNGPSLSPVLLCGNAHV